MSRRAFLAGGAVGVAALATGCRHAAPSRPDPDAAALAAARDTEQRLVDAYAALGDSRSRDVHTAHLAALGASASSSPTASPSPAGDPASLVRASVSSLQAAAVAAHSGGHAAVFASIAASHAAAVVPR